MSDEKEIRALIGLRWIAAFYVFIFHIHIRWPVTDNSIEEHRRMSLPEIIKNLTQDRALEIYNDAPLADPDLAERDYARLDWRGYEALPSFAPPPALAEGLRAWPPSLSPPPDLLAAHDLAILTDVLEYSDNLLLTLQNAAALVKPGGSLLIAFNDRRYTRNCLRTSPGLAAVLAAARQGGPGLGPLAFEAVFNASLAYDLPSFWHSGNIVERDGLALEEALRIWEEVAGGRKYYLPYWAFSEESFLDFLKELLASGLFDFSLEALVQVRPYERRFHALLSPRPGLDGDGRRRLVTEQSARLDEMLSLYRPAQVTLRGDGEDALRAQVRLWEVEHHKLLQEYRALEKAIGLVPKSVLKCYELWLRLATWLKRG